MSGPVAPGLAVTLYPGDSARDLEGGRALLEEARPPIVQLHTVPGPKSAAVADEVRRIVPGARIWFGIPANPLVRDDGPARAARMALTARSIGAEAIVLNCERPSAAGNPGWTPDTTPCLTPAEIDERMRRLLGFVAPELGAMVLGFTSHDMPLWHHLPWAAALGKDSPVRLHLPQQYAAPSRSKKEPSLPAPTSWKAARKRAEDSDGQWLRLVRSGVVRADLGPGGAGFATYGQCHDIVSAGVMLVADRTDISCVWALNAATGEPDRRKFPKCDALGAFAIRALMRVRREAGEGAGSIARWQASNGLEPDGIVGPRTLAALGL